MRRLTSAKFVLLLAFLAAPVSEVVAQTKIRDHRSVTKVEAQPGKKLEIERPQPIRRATDQILVDDWIGKHDKAPAKLKTGQSVVVVADDIEFPARQYSVRTGATSKNVILIANRIRLTGPVTFDLAGGQTDKVGGDLTVITRQLICDTNGKLSIRSNGMHGNPPGGVGASRPGGNGGNIVIAAEHVDIHGKPDRAPLKFTKFTKMLPIVDIKSPLKVAPKYVAPVGPVPAQANPLGECISYFNKGGSGQVAGRDGEFHVFSKFHDAVVKEPRAEFAISRWVISLLEALQFDIANSAALDDRVRVIQLFLKYKGLIEKVDKEKLVYANHKKNYYELMQWLEKEKDELSSLWYYPVKITQAGVPRSLNVFVEGMNLQPAIPPTETLVRMRSIGGRKVLGLLEFSSERPDEIAMNFEVEMTADPWLRSQVAKELAATGWGYPGVFVNWSLRPGVVSEMGIKDSQITPSRTEVSGTSVLADRLQISLKLDTNKASLALFKLASSGGLPLKLAWAYKDDPKIAGTWEGTLSLLRRAESEIAITDNGHVTNKGKTPITVEYVQVGDEFHSFLPAVPTIGPGETIALSLPKGADRTRITIPPEAVAYDVDPFDLEANFVIVSHEQLVEKITVTNLLGFDEQRGGALEYVNINLEYMVGEEPNASSVSTGPYRLAPAGAVGSELTLPFLKPRQANRRIQVTGTAIYENGKQALIAKTFSDLTVKITRDMLPPIK